GYNLGIHFVGALSGNHVDHLFHDIHVGIFQRTLQQPTHAVFTGRTLLRVSADNSFQKQVAADGLQAGGVNKIHQQDVAHLLRFHFTLHECTDDTVGADGDTVGAFRNIDRRLQHHALVIHQLTFAIDLQLAV